MRPEPIILFEKVFFASLGVGIANAALSWDQVGGMLDDPAIRATGIGGGALALSLAFQLLLPLLLWFFIARRPRVIAKWVFVILTALGLLGFLAVLADPEAPPGMLTIGGAVATLLQIYAAWLLFTPEAKEWLGERDGPDDADLSD